MATSPTSKMAERDYRVTYKTQEVSRDSDRYDGPRSRIPTALDPYDYPNDRDELKRAVAESRVRNSRYRDDYRDYESPVRSSTIRDDVTTSTIRDPARSAATKTTYSVTPAGLEKESEVSLRKSGTTAPRESVVASRQTDYRERDEYDLSRSTTRSSARQYDDRDFSRTERVYDVERPRRDPGPYVVDVRDAEVLEIYPDGRVREADRGFGGYRNDPYNDRPPRGTQSRGLPARSPDYRQSEVQYLGRDDARTSAPTIQSSGPFMSGARQDRAPTIASAARSQTDFRGPSRTSTRVFEDDRRSTNVAPYGPSRSSTRREEDDFTFVEKTTTRDRAPTIRENFRDPFYGDPSVRDPETPRGRVRSSTFEQSPPDNDYVMVSPQRDDITLASGRNISTPSTNLKSAILREDSYTPDERLNRRRSRSVGFREVEAEGHHAGERFHQRPGAEAEMMGKHLNHYEVDDEHDRMDYRYSSRGNRRDVEMDYDRKDYESTRYTPQRRRSRSQGRRRREEDDNESYVDKYYTKTTKSYR